MSTQKILFCLVDIPLVLVTKRAETAFLMNFLNSFAILSGEVFALNGLLQEECIVHVTSGVTLRLEEGVKVPERALNELASWHLVEAHFKENLAELSADLEKRVQVATLRDLTLSIEIEFLEFSIFPCPASNHVHSEISLELLPLWSKVRSLCHLIALVTDNVDQLPFLHLLHNLLVMSLEIRVLSVLG